MTWGRSGLLISSLAAWGLGAGCKADEVSQAYSLAVKWAMQDRKPEELVRTLTALSDSPFYNLPGHQGKVLVVTWTTESLAVGKTRHLGEGEVLWVTLAPELAKFCLAHLNSDPKAARLRAEQLLGLPRDFGATNFIEFWAEVKDIARPAPDPEPSDHEAVADFSSSQKFTTTDSHYVSWFKNNRIFCYGNPQQQYPWTRAGYTCDWAAPPSYLGLSEFIVFGSADLQVVRTTPTDAYLKQPPTTLP